jgi:transcription elongation factor S-II
LVCKHASAADVQPFLIAAAIEEIVHSQKTEAEYKARMRTIIFNLKDKKNPELRRRVVLGEISPEDIAVMSSEEMASDQKQEEIKKIRCALQLIWCTEGFSLSISGPFLSCSVPCRLF